MQLPLDVLRKAGHPRRSTKALVAALVNPRSSHAGNENGDPVVVLDGYRSIPAYCDECAGSASLRRKCATVDCPLWAYRMGATHTIRNEALSRLLAAKKPRQEAR